MKMFENTEKEVFLVEELENRLAIEGSNYQHRLDANWQTEKFDPEYFSTFITGPLYAEFVQTIYDRIKPLNSHETNRFLTLSIAQFKTHTPERRENDFILNYWHTYWYPNVMDDNVNEHDSNYAKHIWRHYTKHFHLFKDSAEKALNDFRAGLLGSHSAVVGNHSGSTEPKIQYESFSHFIKQLEYNYPYRIAPFDFKYSMRDYLDYLKTEILDNLIVLSKDKQKAYLNKIRYELQNRRQHAWATQEDIQQWLNKYNIASEEEIRGGNRDNELYRILSSEPPSMREEFEEDFNRDTHGIQQDFYNYYYGYYIDAALNFIDEQLIGIDPASAARTTEPVKNQRIKTNLSVPQLALLFSQLNELKPNIFDIKSEAELHRFISASFETKKSPETGISTEKLRQLFNQPDSKAAEFWEQHLQTMIARVRKLK